MIMTEFDTDTIRFIVEMGTWAISGDNSQHWKLSWDGKILQISHDLTRAEFSYDVKRESVLQTFGALIENIKIAASSRKLSMHYELGPNIVESDDMAKVWFEKEVLITKDGWPVAQPRFTRRPSASMKIAWPSG